MRQGLFVALSSCFLLLNTQALRLSLDSEPPNVRFLLIYQYGKVASSSLEISLGAKLQPPHRVPYTAEVKASYGNSAKVHSKEVAEAFLNSVPEGSEVVVITQTRNRLFQKVSAFFQNLDKYVPREEALKMPMADLRARFDAGCGSGWFTTNFMPVTGVDLLQHATFMREGGVLEHKVGTKRLKIVLLRFEDMESWPRILEPVFGNITLVKTNIGRKKWYAPIYKEFMNTLNFSRYEIDCNCHHETVRFYADDELCTMMPDCCPRRPEHKAAVFDDADVGQLSVQMPDGHELLVADLSAEPVDDDEDDR